MVSVVGGTREIKYSSFYRGSFRITDNFEDFSNV